MRNVVYDKKELHIKIEVALEKHLEQKGKDVIKKIPLGTKTPKHKIKPRTY